MARTNCRPQRRQPSWTSRMTRAQAKLSPPSVPGHDPKSVGEQDRQYIDRRGGRPALRHRDRKPMLLVSPRQPPPVRPGDCDCWCRLIFIRTMTAARSGRGCSTPHRRWRSSAIVNPSSGPGDERNLDYAAVFTEASNRGITLWVMLVLIMADAPSRRSRTTSTPGSGFILKFVAFSSTSSLANVNTRCSSPNSVTMQSGNSEIR